MNIPIIPGQFLKATAQRIVTALGFTPENAANKYNEDSFSNKGTDELFPSVRAVNNFVVNSLDGYSPVKRTSPGRLTGGTTPQGIEEDAGAVGDAGDPLPLELTEAISFSLTTAPAPAAEYEDLRSGSAFSYLFEDLDVSKRYLVRLHFLSDELHAAAELWKFNVDINSVNKLTDYDTWVEAGELANVALQEDFALDAGITEIEIEFTAVGAAEAQIAIIEIFEIAEILTPESLTQTMSGRPEADAVSPTDKPVILQNDIHVLFEGETTVYTFRGQYGGKDAFTKQGVETPVDFEAENDVIYFSPPNARWFVTDGDAGTIAFSLSDTANVWEATNWVDYSDLPVAITFTPIPTLKQTPAQSVADLASELDGEAISTLTDSLDAAESPLPTYGEVIVSLPAVKATSIGTAIDRGSAGYTVTIGSLTGTIHTGAIARGSSPIDYVANLVSWINANSTEVVAVDNLDGTFLIESIVEGTAGNSIETTTTDEKLSFTGATLSGGAAELGTKKATVRQIRGTDSDGTPLIFKAWISQSGTNAPTFIVPHSSLNTLGIEAADFQYLDVGRFTLNKTGAFATNRSRVVFTSSLNGLIDLYARVARMNNDELVLYCVNHANDTFSNDEFKGWLTIELYPEED